MSAIPEGTEVIVIIFGRRYPAKIASEPLKRKSETYYRVVGWERGTIKAVVPETQLEFIDGKVNAAFKA